MKFIEAWILIEHIIINDVISLQEQDENSII